MIRMVWLLALILFIAVGCKSIENSIKDYDACMADPVCKQDVERYASYTHVVTESAVSQVSVPSFAEGMALVISNVVAFIFGVIKGKKKR